MAELSAEERALLGLAADDVVELVGEREAPPSPVGKAFASERSLEEIVETLDLEPDFDPVFETAAALPEVKQWARAPGIYSLEWTADVLRGEHAEWADRRVVDARHTPALIRLHVGQDTFVARFDGRKATVFRTEAKTRHRIDPPAPVERIEIPAPELASLLGDRSTPAWLESAFGELAPSPYAPSRLAAAGLVVRGWGPASPEERARETERLIAGERSHIDAVRSWVESISAPTRRAVEESATADAEVLPEQAEALAIAFERGAAVAESIAGALVRARDDLTSVDVALGLVGEGDALRRALADTDDAIALHMTPLTQCAAAVRATMGEARLRALRRLDAGESWWLGGWRA
ncbi:MAG TPA: hypothetical protein RMH85_24580 [Polyangiaceae bacterium LLY-WYZ-15_(1-7)]|nr:hypothetical protein [Polyangiaceae bacterium LLY-WYZ-15_(1-7)]HJL11675.1 hypothetical protein [Polyangiaceae bacterium LLY-WYZ-15_(1-7)]HJL36000.1 hypothetical protein [Polyangiaceae bacterium LLY-WYZ-15_(1-7)]